MDHDLLRDLLGQSIKLLRVLLFVTTVLSGPAGVGCGGSRHEQDATASPPKAVGGCIRLWQEVGAAAQVVPNQERLLAARTLWMGAERGEESQAIREMLRRGWVREGMSVHDLRRVFGPFLLDAGGDDVAGLLLLTTTEAYAEWVKFDFAEEAAAPDALVLTRVSLVYQVKPLPEPELEGSAMPVRVIRVWDDFPPQVGEIWNAPIAEIALSAETKARLLDVARQRGPLVEPRLRELRRWPQGEVSAIIEDVAGSDAFLGITFREAEGILEVTVFPPPL